MRRPLRQRGSVLVTVLVILVLTIGLSASLLTANMAHNREAQTLLAAERAFHLAEAGIDFGISEVRIRNGGIPDPARITRQVNSTGFYEVEFVMGDACGRDLDGDGSVDNVEQADFTVLRSTGRSGQIQRRIEVILRQQLVLPEINSACVINVGNPVVDLRGNSFMISGEEHDLLGTVLPFEPAKSGIGSPANPDDIILQIAANRQDQVVGVGAPPSVTLEQRIDLDALVAQALGGASILLVPGTHTHAELGSPSAEGVEAVYCAGDLHLSGNSVGAGILVVDGDLTISGALAWVGVIIVRGEVTMVGGGGGKRVVGALLVGEEIIGTDTTAIGVNVSGTVDMFYSSEAILMAQQRLVTVSLVAWRQVGMQ